MGRSSQSNSRLGAHSPLSQESRLHQLRLHLGDLRVFRDQLKEAARSEPFQLLPFLLLTRNGVILQLTDSAAQLLGVDRDAGLFRPVTEFLRPVEIGRFFKFLTLSAASNGVQRGEFSFLHQPAEAQPLVLLTRRLESARGERPFFVISIFDPNGASALSARRTRASSDYGSLIKALDGTVWEADLPLRFTYVSEHCKKLLGFSAREWLQDPGFWENHVFGADRERVLRARELEIRKGCSHTLQYRMVTADRRLIYVKDSVEYVQLPGGDAKLVGIITDVTELEEARERLAQANQALEEKVQQRTEKLEQSTKAMETLCYGIAHDLKSPIRCVQGMLEMIVAESGGQLNGEARGHVNRAQNALVRMGDLVDAVLTFGRLNHSQPDLFAISSEEVLNTALALLQPAIDEAHAAVHVARPLPRVVGNPYLLEHVFVNLINNALKFVEPGTRPEIIIRVMICERKPGEPPLARFSITDNGIGIPVDQQYRIFGMFQKLHRAVEYAGTGVGLALVKRAVEMMNGHVGVYSEAGQGSSFWIELPLAAEG